MKFDTFELERFQSTWENRVEINLSESGVHPLTIRELLRLAGRDTAFLREMTGRRLGYSQTNGTIPLRRNIAQLYRGATPDHVEVTNGGAEANFVTFWRLVDKGDEVVIMMPNYLQGWGVAHILKARVKEWWLRPAGGSWAPDLDELKKFITRKTKLIAICNPNNPTGAVLSHEAMELVVDKARWARAWLLSDEVYQGAELHGSTTPSFWSIGAGGKAPYQKLIVTNSLSKAYGLPGLRVGWIVGQPQAVENSWAMHDYITIGPGALNDSLATVALEAGVRRAILMRTRKILKLQWPVLEQWAQRQAAHLRITPPCAGAIAMLNYSYPLNSTRFAEKLRQEKSVLIVPGDHFGMDGYLRIGFGGDASHLKKGLKRLEEFIHHEFKR